MGEKVTLVVQDNRIDAVSFRPPSNFPALKTIQHILMRQIMGLRAKSQSAFTRFYFCYVISHIGREQQEIIATSEQKKKSYKRVHHHKTKLILLLKSIMADKVSDIYISYADTVFPYLRHTKYLFFVISQWADNWLCTHTHGRHMFGVKCFFFVLFGHAIFRIPGE